MLRWLATIEVLENPHPRECGGMNALLSCFLGQLLQACFLEADGNALFGRGPREPHVSCLSELVLKISTVVAVPESRFFSDGAK